jgi:hypothetical protein
MNPKIKKTKPSLVKITQKLNSNLQKGASLLNLTIQTHLMIKVLA